jgi:hypothetical protein
MRCGASRHPAGPEAVRRPVRRPVRRCTRCSALRWAHRGGTALAGLALVALAPGVADAAWRTAGSGSATATAGVIGTAAAPATSVAGDRVTLTWAPVRLLGPLLGTDRASVVGFRQDGVTEVGPFALDPSCTDTTATSCTTIQPIGESWRYAVVARLGGWSGPSGPASAGVSVTLPPTSSVTSPSGTAVNAGGWDAACPIGAGVCGTATPGDGDGGAIVRVEVRITDPHGRSLDTAGDWVASEVWRTALERTPAAAGEPAPLAWHLPLAAVLLDADGTYTVAVRVGDTAGWEHVAGTSGHVLVDRVAPVTTSDAPSGVQASATTITLSATDERSGVATTEFRTSTDAVTFTPWTMGTTVALTTSATHTVEFRSTDVAGNVESPRSATVTVDLSPPTVVLITPADATTVLSRDVVSLSAHASHPSFAVTSVQFAWSRDRSTWTPIGDPVTTGVADVFATTGTLPAGALHLRATATRTGGVQGVAASHRISVRPEILAIALEDVGDDVGTAGPGDRIVITVSDALDPASVCSTFDASADSYSHSDLTVTFSGNPNIITITSTGGCGTSGFGSLQVGSTGIGRYTQGARTLAFAGSTLTWDPEALQLRLTLGATRTGTATAGASAAAVYSPGGLTSGGVAVPAGEVRSASEESF